MKKGQVMTPNLFVNFKNYLLTQVVNARFQTFG